MFVDALDEFFKVYSFAKRKGIIIYAMDIMKKDFLPDIIFSHQYIQIILLRKEFHIH